MECGHRRAVWMAGGIVDRKVYDVGKTGSIMDVLVLDRGQLDASVSTGSLSTYAAARAAASLAVTGAAVAGAWTHFG